MVGERTDREKSGEKETEKREGPPEGRERLRDLSREQGRDTRTDRESKITKEGWKQRGTELETYGQTGGSPHRMGPTVRLWGSPRLDNDPVEAWFVGKGDSTRPDTDP